MRSLKLRKTPPLLITLERGRSFSESPPRHQPQSYTDRGLEAYADPGVDPCNPW